MKLIARGAEAELYEIDWFGMRAVMKIRRPKAYRDPELDRIIRTKRTLNEVRLMSRAHSAGIKVPAVYFFNPAEGVIIMQYIEGPTAKQLLETGKEDVLYEVGALVAKLHKIGIVHGDLALTNFIYQSGATPYIIDMGLGYFVEPKRAVLEYARDVNVLMRILDTYGHKSDEYKELFWSGYASVNELAEVVKKGVDVIRASARYVER
ncbi:KEOPS complex kinase/ATPase Bud32 [Thermoproteus tenax]|nr:KEOPS complex kinase/ATPase Bud32 [Thermoproteus tenax]